MNKSVRVDIRLSEAEKDMALADAERNGMNLSDYLRSLLALGHALAERKAGSNKE